MTAEQSDALRTAVVLVEVNTDSAMPRCFFGERILVEVIYVSGGWFGKTAGLSRFCQRALTLGTEVAGPIVNGHYVISNKWGQVHFSR